MKIQREELRRFSIAERVQLVEEIWDSIEEDAEDLPITDTQRVELDRRLAEYEGDPSGAKTWAELREDLDREP
jgi:putative addiction module component (TIGR02574 family)